MAAASKSRLGEVVRNSSGKQKKTQCTCRYEDGGGGGRGGSRFLVWMNPTPTPAWFHPLWSRVSPRLNQERAGSPTQHNGADPRGTDKRERRTQRQRRFIGASIKGWTYWRCREWWREGGVRPTTVTLPARNRAEIKEFMAEIKDSPLITVWNPYFRTVDSSERRTNRRGYQCPNFGFWRTASLSSFLFKWYFY